MASQILRNISWLAVANVVVKPIWFVFITYVCIRYLGIRQFGFMTAALALMGIIDGALTLGTSPLTVREVAKEKSRSGLYFSNFLPFRAFASMLAIGMGLLVELLLGNSALLSTALFAGSYVLTRNLTEYCRTLFRAHEVFKYEAASTVIEKVLVVLGGSLFLFMRPTSSSVLLGMTIGMAATFLLNYHWIARKFTVFAVSKINVSFFREAMPKAIPLGLASVFVLLYFRTDSVMIEAFKGELATGQYAMAFRITEALLILPSMVVTVLLPRLSNLFSVSHNRFRSLTRNSIVGIVLVSLVVAGLIYNVAPAIINSMERSSDSAPAIHLLRILIWAFPLSAVNYVLSTMLTAGDKQNRLALILGLAAVLNIVLNLMMIPSMSAVGAAYATIITQLFVTVFFMPSLGTVRSRRTQKLI